MSETTARASELPALRLLSLEQFEFEGFLHDDLGQCLVAIRSMAAALDDEAPNEIAQMISQAADDAYIEVYDRMMELRAESLATGPAFGPAIQQCIDDARLESRNLAPRLNLDTGVEEITSPLCRRLLLRSLRCVVAVVKRMTEGDAELVIDLENGAQRSMLSLQLLPGGFPEAVCEHPRIRQLETRIRAFDGELSRAAAVIRVNLPCRENGGA